MNVTIDFYSDWIACLREELVVIGYAADPADDSFHVALKYFNVLKRRISTVPRRFIPSREFSVPAGYQPPIDAIRMKVETGDDLAPHLSKFILDADYNDALLNDWGIYHLHLGLNPTAGFVERTGPLLFARISHDTFYAIDVMPHGSWTRQRLVEIIHANWPETIAGWRIRGILSIRPAPTDEEIADLRKSNVSMFLQLQDGTIYAPIGGGYTTSGVAIDCVEAHDRFAQILRAHENYVKTHIDELTELAAQQNMAIGASPHFRLGINKGDFYALEQHARIAFKLGPIK